MENSGATVVITHHVLDGKQQVYEKLLNEIEPICRKSPGNIDWQLIRPIPNLTYAYTFIIRYDSIENLRNWMESGERKNFINNVKPLLAKDDNYYVQGGLDFLFISPKENQKVPVRWKQFLVTWSAIYPLSILVPFFFLPVFRMLHFPDNHYLHGIFISGSIVFIMVYLLMPKYTQLIRNWLYINTNKGSN